MRISWISVGLDDVNAFSPLRLSPIGVQCEIYQRTMDTTNLVHCRNPSQISGLWPVIISAYEFRREIRKGTTNDNDVTG